MMEHRCTVIADLQRPACIRRRYAVITDSGFDENGKFLDMWTTGVRSLPYAHLITTDQFLWIADGGTNRIVKYDLNGHYLYGWGTGGAPGVSSMVRTP
jgi:hypothetical protein